MKSIMNVDLEYIDYEDYSITLSPLDVEVTYTIYPGEWDYSEAGGLAPGRTPDEVEITDISEVSADQLVRSITDIEIVTDPSDDLVSIFSQFDRTKLMDIAEKIKYDVDVAIEEYVYNHTDELTDYEDDDYEDDDY